MMMNKMIDDNIEEKARGDKDDQDDNKEDEDTGLKR